MELQKRETRLKKVKPANFIKVNVEIKDEPTATFWVGLLTMLPVPVILIKMFSGLAANLISQHTEYDITQRELLDLLNAMNGLKVDIVSDDANVQVEVY